jgi:hypothetical protein
MSLFELISWVIFLSLISFIVSSSIDIDPSYSLLSQNCYFYLK